MVLREICRIALRWPTLSINFGDEYRYTEEMLSIDSNRLFRPVLRLPERYTHLFRQSFTGIATTGRPV